jgi:[acyl-carrier-protein] S-malonyltransferase
MSFSEGLKMKFAFVFPGQGSQSVGMMAGYSDHVVIRQTFVEAADTLKQDYWRLAHEGPAEDLAKTVITQPLMLTADIAVWRYCTKQNMTMPSLMAGHSLGEYAALVASGVLSFEDALRLTRFRAEQMQAAVPEGMGGMAAILGLEDSEVEAACQEAAQGEVLEAANFNSPGQVVIAGTKEAVLRGIETAKARGAKRAIALAMSVPSHCGLMRGAAERLSEMLSDITLHPPSIPVLHNCDMQSHQNSEAMKHALTQQLFLPVRWVGTVRSMADQGVTAIAECGPGKVLAPLCKRIDERLVGYALNDQAGIEQWMTTLQGTPS